MPIGARGHSTVGNNIQYSCYISTTIERELLLSILRKSRNSWTKRNWLTNNCMRCFQYFGEDTFNIPIWAKNRNKASFQPRKGTNLNFFFTNLNGNKVIYKGGKMFLKQLKANDYLRRSSLFNKRHTGKAEYMVTCSCTKAIPVNLC